MKTVAITGSHAERCIADALTMASRRLQAHITVIAVSWRKTKAN
jgi:hypothetical protein